MNRYLSILMMVLLLIGISVSVEMETKQKDEAMRRLSGCFRDRLRRFRHHDGKSNDHCEKDEGCKPANLEKYLKDRQCACKDGSLYVDFQGDFATVFSGISFSKEKDGAFSAASGQVNGIINCDHAYFTLKNAAEEPLGSCQATFYHQDVTSLGLNFAATDHVLDGTCSDFDGKVSKVVGHVRCVNDEEA